MALEKGLHQMRKWDEATALAITLANTRTTKRPDDLLTVASAMTYLVELYGSQKEVAAKAGVHPEMIRQFLTVLRLSGKTQKLFASRQIDSVDIAKELVTLKDLKQQELAAVAIANMTSKDARDVKRLIKNAKCDVEDAKTTVLEAKPSGLNIFLLDFTDDVLDGLRREAKRRKMKPAELVREIVTKWLNEKSSPGKRSRG